MANKPFDTSNIIRCGTTQYMNKLKAADPSLSGRLNDYESKLQESIKASNPKTEGDTMCFDENKGQVVAFPYKGRTREWKYYGMENGKYCYRVIKLPGEQ